MDMAVSQVASVSVEKIAPTESARPLNAHDKSAFDHEMSVNSVDGAERANHINAPQTIQMQPINNHPTQLGDRVLDGVDRLRVESRQHMEDIMVSLSDPNISSADMMKVTFDMNLWSLKQDLLAKSAGGIDRSVDNLLKAQ